MMSDKLWDFLESCDSIISKSTSFEKCDELLQRINEIFNIRDLNPSKYSNILQCRSKDEEVDFKLAQDVSMTKEILNNFKGSNAFLIVPRSIHEFNEDIKQRLAEIQYKVFSIVFKDLNRNGSR